MQIRAYPTLTLLLCVSLLPSFVLRQCSALAVPDRPGFLYSRRGLAGESSLLRGSGTRDALLVAKRQETAAVHSKTEWNGASEDTETREGDHKGSSVNPGTQERSARSPRTA
jgi:hypothetical protein